MAATATFATKNQGFRLLCRASDLDDKGLPLCHPLILPAFILGLAGFVTCIVAWAIDFIPLIGALVVVPLAMVYCMGVKSFHKDCGKCLGDRDRDPESAMSSGMDYSSKEQESTAAPNISRRAMASPKRIGKRQSQLAAQQEKIKKLNSALESDTEISNSSHVPKKETVHQNGDVNSNENNTVVNSPKISRSPMPDVESPLNIDLVSNRSLSENKTENEISNRGSPSLRAGDMADGDSHHLAATAKCSEDESSFDLVDSADSDSDSDEMSTTVQKSMKNYEKSQNESQKTPNSDKEQVPPPGYYQATNPAFDEESERL